MDETSISAFNEQFIPYCGAEIRGTLVKALVSISKANNVKINVSAGEIENREIYTVVESYDETGMINKITVMKDGIEINVENQTEDKEKVENEYSSMDALMVSTFNQQFMSYCGPNVKGILVKALISISKTNNIDVNVSAYEINDQANYTVLESYGKDGMINKITITEN